MHTRRIALRIRYMHKISDNYFNNQKFLHLYTAMKIAAKLILLNREWGGFNNLRKHYKLHIKYMPKNQAIKNQTFKTQRFFINISQ